LTLLQAKELFKTACIKKNGRKIAPKAGFKGLNQTYLLQHKDLFWSVPLYSISVQNICAVLDSNEPNLMHGLTPSLILSPNFNW
jgi:hypothetical protein